LPQSYSVAAITPLQMSTSHICGDVDVYCGRVIRLCDENVR